MSIAELIPQYTRLGFSKRRAVQIVLKDRNTYRAAGAGNRAKRRSLAIISQNYRASRNQPAANA